MQKTSKRNLERELAKSQTTIASLHTEIVKLKDEIEKLNGIKHCDNVVLCQNCKHGIRQKEPIVFKSGERLSGYVACDLHISGVCECYVNLIDKTSNQS